MIRLVYKNILFNIMKNKDIVLSNRVLYTPSAFARESLIYLQEIGCLEALKAHSSSREYLDSFLFLLVNSGEGKLLFSGKEYTLKKGDCAFIDCSKGYTHITKEKLWSINWIHFNGNNMLGIYSKYMERGGEAVFHQDSVENYNKIFNNIFSIASSDDFIRDIKINQELSALLTLIMKMSWIPKNQVDLKHINGNSLKEIKTYIDENWNKEITLIDLEKKFFINKYYLLRLFKKHYDKTILSYIIEKRITNAKKMLRFSGDAIKIISNKCGFNDANYFSRVFKKVEGISPLEYRNAWGQKNVNVNIKVTNSGKAK